MHKARKNVKHVRKNVDKAHKSRKRYNYVGSESVGGMSSHIFGANVLKFEVAQKFVEAYLTFHVPKNCATNEGPATTI